jgi:hypothetical protein
MNPVVQTSLEHLPAVAAVTGAMAGAALDLVAQHSIAQNREAMNEALPDLAEHYEPTRGRRVIRAVGSVTAAVTSLAFLANANVWAPEAADQVSPPGIELVVDYSGATGIIDDGAAAKTEAEYVGVFGALPDVNVEALVASGGVFETMRPADIANETPAGDAPLTEATQSALDKARLVKTEALRENTPKTMGIVVLTNGNSIGEPEVVIATANETGTPVYVVNVDNGQGDPAVAEGLKTITEKTGGAFWTASTTNSAAVSQEVRGSLEGSLMPEKEQDQSVKLPDRILTGALGLLTVAYVFNRRKRTMAATFNGSKDRS